MASSLIYSSWSFIWDSDCAVSFHFGVSTLDAVLLYRVYLCILYRYSLINHRKCIWHNSNLIDCRISKYNWSVKSPTKSPYTKIMSIMRYYLQSEIWSRYIQYPRFVAECIIMQWPNEEYIKLEIRDEIFAIECVIMIICRALNCLQTKWKAIDISGVLSNSFLQANQTSASGGWFNIKLQCYQYRKSHCGD